MTNKEIIKQIKSDHGDTGEYDSRYDYEDSDYLELVEEGEWTQNHKYQYLESIYWSSKHEVFICINESRSGSYHSDWYYDPPELSVVEKVEKVVTKTIVSWVPV